MRCISPLWTHTCAAGEQEDMSALHGEALALVAHDGKKADAICFSVEPENREPK